jgi:hypothetical protein
VTRGRCSICGHKRFLFYESATDWPFFFYASGHAQEGRHCLRCERWLQTGSTWRWRDVLVLVAALLTLALLTGLIDQVR